MLNEKQQHNWRSSFTITIGYTYNYPTIRGVSDSTELPLKSAFEPLDDESPDQTTATRITPTTAPEA